MNYNEVCQQGQEVFDYARCQRPNGTFYGTSGTCRKGTPAGAKEKVAKTSKTKSAPKKTKPTTLAEGETLEKFKGTETVNRLTARNKELMARAKADPDEADIIQTQIDKNNKILDKYKRNTEVLNNLVKNAPEGTQISITQKGAVQMDYTTKSGQEVKVVFGNKDYNFQVNGGYDAGTVTDRRQQIEVANAVRRNWEGLVKSLPEGAVVGTAAWTEDGRGASRSRAYERMGFSAPAGGPGGNQYAKKSGGKMVPSSGSEEGLDKTYQFAEKTLSPTALWYVAVFGTPEKKNDFSEADALDYARCQRPDGTFYGTSGKCRKGAPVGPKEKAALKKAAKSGNKKAEVALKVVEGKMTKAQALKELKSGKEPAAKKPAPKKSKAKPKAESEPKNDSTSKKGYSPRDSGSKTGVKAKFGKDAFGGKSSSFDEKAVQERIDRVKASKRPAADKKKMIERLEKMKSQVPTNKKFVEDVGKNLPKGHELEVTGNGTVKMTYKTKAGDTVVSTYSPRMGYEFRVNGTLNAGQAKGGIEAARAVRRQFDALVKAAPTGHILKTSAYKDDGKGAARQKAYEAVGFSKDKPGKDIFAVKQADGRLVPGTKGARGKKSQAAQEDNPDAMWFEESDMDDVWYKILFGVE